MDDSVREKQPSPPVRKRTTLRDVAKMAGVTPSTVSRLLNDKPLPVAVTDATRQRVMEAARALAYRPNRLARGLAAAQTHVLGMSFPMTSPLDRTDHRDITFLNLGMIISGVQRITQSRGYELHIFNRVEHDFDPESPPPPMGLDFIDGLIYVEPNPRYEYYADLAASGLPLVMLGPNPLAQPVYHVCADNRLELYRLTRALLDKGHRRIAYHLALMNEPPLDVIQRVEGYRQAHEEAGVPLDPLLLRNEHLSDMSLSFGIAEILRANPRPTALLVGRPESVNDILRLLHQAEIRVPQDIELVSIGDDRFFEATVPHISALRFGYLEMAAEAARILVEVVEGRETEPRHMPVPWTFVSRESCTLELS